MNAAFDVLLEDVVRKIMATCANFGLSWEFFQGLLFIWTQCSYSGFALLEPVRRGN